MGRELVSKGEGGGRRRQTEAPLAKIMLMRAHTVKQNGLIVLSSSHVRAQRLREVTLPYVDYCNPPVITEAAASSHGRDESRGKSAGPSPLDSHTSLRKYQFLKQSESR